MYKIVDLILEYRRTFKESTAKEILSILKPMIVKKSLLVRFDYREDIIQELEFALFDLIKKVKIIDTRLSVDLFNDNNYKYLIKEKFSNIALKNVFNNPYLQAFLNETGIEILEHAFINNGYLTFNEMFLKFNFKNQFFNLLSKTFDSVISSFYRKNSYYLKKVELTLNRENSKGNENIELISYEEKEDLLRFEDFNFSERDKMFLLYFINGDKIRTQKEVAKILNVSQQSVAKRIKRIRKTYKILK